MMPAKTILQKEISINFLNELAIEKFLNLRDLLWRFVFLWKYSFLFNLKTVNVQIDKIRHQIEWLDPIDSKSSQLEIGSSCLASSTDCDIPVIVLLRNIINLS